MFKRAPHFQFISTLASLALGSSKVRRLVVERRLEKGEPVSVDVRPQLHVAFQAPPGHGKSRILQEIADRAGVLVQTNITYPSLVGTIDAQTKQLIPPVTWDVRNRMLVLDEFNWKGTGPTMDAMLQLMEGQRYSRRFGLYSSVVQRKDGDLHLRLKEGEISMRTRFSLVLGTMRPLMGSDSVGIEAFQTRMLVYRYRLDEREMRLLLGGYRLLQVKEWEPERIVTIDRWTFRRIVSMVGKRDEIGDNYYLRTVDDACRIVGVMGRLDPKVVGSVIALRKEAWKRHLAGLKARETAKERHRTTQKGVYK